MNIQNSPYFSALHTAEPQAQQTKQPAGSNGRNFHNILEGMVQETDNSSVKFSRHALNRLSQRGITLSDEQIMRLTEGMDKASGKGIKEPLVLIDDLAFIVSTANKTVITAMGQEQREENIFTNIDGAVIN